jgi:gluconolactonase
MNLFTTFEKRIFIGLLFLALILSITLNTDVSCNILSNNESKNSNRKIIGTVESYNSDLNNIIDSGAKVEIIADGFVWSEGPLWVEKYNMLLFSDVPSNTVYKWTEAKGKEVYLKPSGFNGIGSKSKETGSNGLTFDLNGNLVLCQHGNRQMARMDAPLDKPEATFFTIADKYKGKRFSSPNDAVYNSQGELFFTDPPYGLQSQDDTDPKKEIAFNGVYKMKQNGTVILLADSITRPNGLAFFPDEKKIIISSSDPDKPNWYLYEIEGDSFINGKIFYSTTGYNKSLKGLPDGLKIDKKGNVFATGPGGVYVFNSDGKKMGLIKLEKPASNCTLSPDEKILYITNEFYLLRIKMRN